MNRLIQLLILPAITTALAMAPAPALVAEDPAAPVLLGGGSQHYQWVHDWAKLPANVTFGGTHGCVMVDSKDNIYVNTEGQYAVLVFKSDGTFIKGWGKEYAVQAHGMFLYKDPANGGREVIWLAHFGRHEVVKFTLDGEVLQTIKWPEKSGVYANDGEFKPTSVAVAPSGDVYVADGYGKGYVSQFTAKGEFIRCWNGKDGKAGQFNCPHGVGIDTRTKPARVVICDRENHRLQLFSLNGDYLSEVEGLRRPCKAIFRGDTLVVPDLAGRVTVFDKDYKVLAQLGDNPDESKRANYDVPPSQWKDGEFTAPHGANWDSKGNLYVEDWNHTGRVSKLMRIP